MQAEDTGVMSFFAILLIIAFLGFLVLLAGLLAYPRTRPFGLALLGVFGVVGLLLFGVVFSYWKVERVPAQESQIYQDFYHGVPSTLVPGIELEQAAKEMNATAPVAEVVKGSSEDGDMKASDSVSDEDAKEESSKVTAKEAPNLPDWVTALPSTVGGVSRQVISSGPRVDVAECSQAIESTARAAVQQYLSQLAQEEGLSRHAYIPEVLGISTNWIRDNLFCSTPEPYMQTKNYSVGQMQTRYVQLEFDPNDKEFMRQRLIDYVRRDRIAAVTTGGVFALGGIGLLFGLLKFDTWTKGYYTKRLFLGVPAAIIGVGTLLALFIA